MKKPKKGDKLYIPSAYHISRGEDDVDGGLATIDYIEYSTTLPADDYNAIMVGFEEVQGTAYNYRWLLEEQEKLAVKYKDQIATPNPDVNTPWIQKGDIVNGEIYDGKDIW